MLRNARHIATSLSESKILRISGVNQRILFSNRISIAQKLLIRSKKTNPKTSSVSSLFRPLEVRPKQEDDQNTGFEITGSKLDTNEISRIFNKFVQLREIRMLCLENGLDGK